MTIGPDDTFQAALTNLQRFPTLSAHHVSLEAFPSRLMTNLTAAQAKVELQRLRKSKDKQSQEEIVNFLKPLLLAFHQLKSIIEKGSLPSGEGKGAKSQAECPICGGRLDVLGEYGAEKFHFYEAFMLPLLDLARTYRSATDRHRRRAAKEKAQNIVRKALFPHARGDKFFPPQDFVQHYKELVRCLGEIFRKYRQRVRDKNLPLSRRSGQAVQTVLRQEYPFFDPREWKTITSNFAYQAAQASEVSREILAGRYKIHLNTVRKTVTRLRKKSSHPR